MFHRVLEPPKGSFFLFGPRATGKSTWIRAHFRGAHTLDLLRNDTYFRLLSSPAAFRQEVLGRSPSEWIVVDEVQRVPSILHDVHALIEDHGYRFALTGSSARKLKRGGVDLLAGRAVVRKMFPLIQAEYGDDQPLADVLAFGSLPSVLADPQTRIERLEAYAGTYLREEIKEEAMTRNVDAFGRFLEVAAHMHGQVTNLANLARDAHVARATVTNYFEILEDTLLGSRLPAWTPRLRVKEVAHPKFYFFDTGVVRALTGRLRDRPSPEERGILLETTVLNELAAHMSYAGIGGKLSYWRTADGVEVDFIWQRGNRTVAVEAKASSRWRAEYGKGFEALRGSKSKPTRCVGVYLGAETLSTDWGVVMPAQRFFASLAAGKILEPA